MWWLQSICTWFDVVVAVAAEVLLSGEVGHVSDGRLQQAAVGLRQTLRHLRVCHRLHAEKLDHLPETASTVNVRAATVRTVTVRMARSQLCL